MIEIYIHETISFCLPGGKADLHDPPMAGYPTYGVIKGLRSASDLWRTASPLMPCIWGILDFHSIGV